jgi:hypothetical protein
MQVRKINKITSIISENYSKIIDVIDIIIKNKEKFTYLTIL